MSYSVKLNQKLALVRAGLKTARVTHADLPALKGFHPKKKLITCRRCEGTLTEKDSIENCAQCGGRGTEKV